MSGATANRYDLRYVKESVANTTPASPALTFVRNTGESLSKDISTEESQEIRSDRASIDLIPVDASIGGAVEFEMSYGTFDDFFAAAVMSPWVVGDFSGSMTTTTATTDNLTAVGANDFEGVVVGQTILLDNFTTPENNRTYRVVGKTDNQTLSLDPAPDTAETSTADLIGAHIKNGLVDQPFTLVKRFNDLQTVETQIFRGMRVASFNLDMSTASIITGSFDFMGMSAEWDVAEAPTGHTNIAAPTTTVMNAVRNISDISIDGTSLCATGKVSNLTYNYDNQYREQKALCVFGNAGVVPGKLDITISGSQYFTSSAEAQKFENSTAFEFSFGLRDADGNSYYFLHPRCKYSSFAANAAGLDTDVMAEVEFKALYDSVTDAVCIISRIPAQP